MQLIYGENRKKNGKVALDLSDSPALLHAGKALFCKSSDASVFVCAALCRFKEKAPVLLLTKRAVVCPASSKSLKSTKVMFFSGNRRC